MEEEQARIKRALNTLRIKSSRASPACGFTPDDEVFQRLEGPQCQGSKWVKDSHRNARLDKTMIADSEQMRQLLSGQEGKSKANGAPVLTTPIPEFTLRAKLRDHVKDVLISSSLDKEPPVSCSTSAYKYTDEMQTATSVAALEHGLKKDQYSFWSEQVARAKAIGLVSRK